MGSTVGSTFELSVLGSGPYGTYLWGESRAVLNRVLFAAVRAIDPEPLWLELGDAAEDAAEPGPLSLDWIPSDHVFLVDEPAAARPQSGVAKMSLLNLVRWDESTETLRRLDEFVRLAPVAQEIIGQLPPGGRRHALAVANSDVVRSAYPDTANGVRPIVMSLLDAPVLPVIAAAGSPGPGRLAFDFVFEVRAKDSAHWRDGLLVPEKVPAETGIPVGRSIPLPSIPGMEQVFSAPTGGK